VARVKAIMRKRLRWRFVREVQAKAKRCSQSRRLGHDGAKAERGAARLVLEIVSRAPWIGKSGAFVISERSFLFWREMGTHGT